MVAAVSTHMGPQHTIVSDHELVERARTGNYEAFEELVRRYHAQVQRIAFGLTQNHAEAEEVAQDTFLNVFRGLASFRGDSAVGSWIYRVATNAALMVLRRRKRRPQLSLEELPSDVEVVARSPWPVGDWARLPEERLLNDETSQAVVAAIADLPEKYRLVLTMRDSEGLSNDEVAVALGVTVATVKARLHRARLLVRDRLESHFHRGQ